MNTLIALEKRFERDRRFSEVRTDLPLRILVIDDNRDFAYTLSSLLRHLGYESSAAYDEKTGMEKVLDMKPDLVLCDIGLPGRGGYKIGDKIRSDHSLNHTILAALTCYAHEKVKLLVRELGFDFYVTKPIQTSILDDLLTKVQTRKMNLNRMAGLNAV